VTEKPTILVQRRGSFLQPWSPLDEDLLGEFPQAKKLKAVLTQPRSVGRLRLYWALIALVRSNMDSPPTREALHDGVKIRLGLTSPIKFATGEIVDVPRSVAFDKMDEDEFASFFDRFKDLIHASPAMVRAAEQMLGEPL
jgi:hypothetical protein